MIFRAYPAVYLGGTPSQETSTSPPQLSTPRQPSIYECPSFDLFCLVGQHFEEKNVKTFKLQVERDLKNSPLFTFFKASCFSDEIGKEKVLFLPSSKTRGNQV